MTTEQRCIQEHAGRTQRERTPQPTSLAEEQRRPYRCSQETPGDAGSARWPTKALVPPSTNLPQIAGQRRLDFCKGTSTESAQTCCKDKGREVTEKINARSKEHSPEKKVL